MNTVIRGPRPSQRLNRPPRTGYLPSLDGWRALAIVGVLMDHDDPWTLFGYSNAYFHGYGGWGVFLFFAISGFLVCTRILEDESLLGHFQLGKFYVRRFFRIQPAAWVYLAVIALLSAAGITHERPSALLGSFFLISNYQYNSADHTGRWFLTGQFWTLAVEEHFYLVLSLLLFFVRRRRVMAIAGALLACYVCIRFCIHFRLYTPETSMRRSEMMLPFLLFAALLALLLRRKAVLDAAVRYLHPWVAFAATITLKTFLLLRYPIEPGPRQLLRWFVSTPATLFFCFAFWVIATALHPRSWTTRFLELAPLRLLGRLSYSIYLWQGLFFSAGAPEARVHSHAMLLLASRPWRYLAIGGAALASYYFVEKPMIRWGHKLAPPATPGHLDLSVQGTPLAASEVN